MSAARASFFGRARRGRIAAAGSAAAGTAARRGRILELATRVGHAVGVAAAMRALVVDQLAGERAGQTVAAVIAGTCAERVTAALAFTLLRTTRSDEGQDQDRNERGQGERTGGGKAH